MLTIDAGSFVGAVRVLDLIRCETERRLLVSGVAGTNFKDALAATPKDEQFFDVHLKAIHYFAVELSLRVTQKEVLTLIQNFTAYTVQQMATNITHLGATFNRELDGCKFRHIANSTYYEQTPTDFFGSVSCAAFPSLISEMEEAMKCLALERGTASVFHTMRCLEAVCRGLALAVDPATGNLQGWGDYARHAEDRINGANARQRAFAPPSHWRTSKPFFEDVLADLRAMYRAWRNPTMHIEKVYSLERAEEILKAAKTLISDISKHVHEDGKYRA